MKNIYKILIAFIGVLAVSCNADAVDDRPIIEAVSAPEITAPATGKEFVFDADHASDEAAKFTWSKAEYSAPVVVNYKLLIDKKGGDFSKAITLVNTKNSTQVSIVVKDLNQAAIDLGGATGVASEFDVKVASDVSGAVPQISKTAITISVTPYAGKLAYDFTDWYLVGAAVEGGWDNNADTKHQPMFRDGKNADLYKFTGFFKAGNFKLVSEKGSWASQLGKAGSSAIEINSNAGEFTIPAEGYYTFEFNTKSLTFTLVTYDDSAAKTNATVGIIGDSTPKSWDASTAMIKSAFNKHVWSLGITPLNDGGLKFRANDSWEVAWGGNTAFSGGGTGDNIPVEKSKYVIYFNDLDGSYLMIPNQG
jgi:starch-binding outer membrane protein SusE/F